MGISCQRLIKSFGEPPTVIIKGIDLNIEDGDFVSISGRSGSGKSTLLYLLSTLDLPSSGSVMIDGQSPAELSVDALHQFRNESLGFVFQFHYLLPELTALENALLPARKNNNVDAKTHVNALFELFDIQTARDKLPSQLSGGEQQRVAIVRALSMKPRYLFADEPTGNLDSVNSKIVMDILKKANKEWGMTLILVTHEPDYAAMAEKEIFLKDGVIVNTAS
ncbi:MAG: ABC transporter ATP-binding protein [Gammaproteobacteria bacterium]|nr:ABC transporter ATP-binding protein [Gammaproteobacteria bacterium]